MNTSLAAYAAASRREAPVARDSITLKCSDYRADLAISLPDGGLPAAMLASWKSFASAAGLDFLIGYTLISVEARYNVGILGGAGGTEIRINYLVHGKLSTGATGDPLYKTLWVRERIAGIDSAAWAPVLVLRGGRIVAA